ncbi:MAG: hypothetical protein ACU85V_14670 [Gammaproteobacteria bacterium]
MLLSCLLASACLIAPASQAALTGDAVTINYLVDGSVLSTDSVSVGIGAEITCPPDAASLCGLDFGPTTVTVDLDAESIRFQLNGSGSFGGSVFNGPEFADLDWIGTPGEIVGFVFSTNTTLSDSIVSFGPDFVRFNLLGFSQTGDDFFQVDLEVSHVPIPAAFVLFASGLLGVGAVGYGRSRAVARP